jgi:predicted HTH domain antitoxin
MASISVRLPDDDESELDDTAEILDLDRSTTVRKALREGLHDLRVQRAVERYQTGNASLYEAARIAGVSLGEWMQIANEHGLTTQLTAADVERDVEALRDL